MYNLKVKMYSHWKKLYFDYLVVAIYNACMVKQMKKLIIFTIIIIMVSLTACTIGGGLVDIDRNEDSYDGVTDIDSNLSDNNQNEEPQEPEPIQLNVETYIQAKTALNIRGKAGTFGSIVGTLDKNDMLLYLGKEGNWYITVFKDKTAYVSANSLYTKLVEFEKGSEAVEKVLSIGYPLLGYPYIWGSQRYHWGNGRLNPDYIHGRYDCSALVLYMYYMGADINLGLTTREQVRQGATVERSNIQRGDLIFFTNSSRRHLTGNERVGHVAIYLGNNYILHTASDHAVIEPITSRRWNDYITTKRFL